MSDNKTVEPTPTLLMIDDDASILTSLARLIRRARPTWTVHFETDPSLAIQNLDKLAPTTVITDMQMPFVDGKAVLRMLKEYRPETHRIVLSGQCSWEEAQGVQTTGATFLAKPASVETIIKAVERLEHKPRNIEANEEPIDPKDLEKAVLVMLEHLCRSGHLQNQALPPAILERLLPTITRSDNPTMMGPEQVAKHIDSLMGEYT